MKDEPYVGRNKIENREDLFLAINDALRKGDSVQNACKELNVIRKTYYVWKREVAAGKWGEKYLNDLLSITDKDRFKMRVSHRWDNDLENQANKYKEVRRLRNECHLTVEEACAKVGVAKRNYHYWESKHSELLE